MRHPHHRSILIVFTFLLLLCCIYGKMEAAQDPDPAHTLNPAIQDPWRGGIFASREFTTLVVSLQAEEADLYQEGRGIMTRGYDQQGREGERPVSVFVYDRDGTPLIAQNAGIRLSGATSRSALRKSFRIVSRREYDPQHPDFTYDLWGGRTTLDGSESPIRTYDSFVLHSMRLAMDATGIHNSVGYSLARKAGIEDAAPTTPAAVYLNGVYQGAYFILPAKNDQALAELYHIRDPEDIEVVSVFEEEKTGVQTAPDVLEAYLSFVSWLGGACDMNDPADIAELERRLDVDQCLEYYAVNLLLGNGDWLDNNLRVWRCKDNGLPYQDGRWRFFLFDLDWIGSFPDLVSMNFQQAACSEAYYNILPFLLRNPDYLDRFCAIIARMEQDAFCPEIIEEVFAEEEARMVQEASYDFQSEAFVSYLVYSYESGPPGEEDYLTLEDRQFLIEDFKGHLLKSPDIINECLAAYAP